MLEEWLCKCPGLDSIQLDATRLDEFDTVGGGRGLAGWRKER